MIKQIINAVDGIAQDRSPVVPAYGMVRLQVGAVMAHSAIARIRVELRHGWPKCAVDLADLKKVAKVMSNPTVSRSGYRLFLKEGDKEMTIPCQDAHQVEFRIPELVPDVTISDVILKDAITNGVRVLLDSDVPTIENHVLLYLKGERPFIACMTQKQWVINDAECDGEIHLEIPKRIAAAVAKKIPGIGYNMTIAVHDKDVVLSGNGWDIYFRVDPEKYLTDGVVKMVKGLNSSVSDGVHISRDQWKEALSAASVFADESTGYAVDIEPTGDVSEVSLAFDQSGRYSTKTIVPDNLKRYIRINANLLTQAIDACAGPITGKVVDRPTMSIILSTPDQVIMVAGLTSPKYNNQ